MMTVDDTKTLKEKRKEYYSRPDIKERHSEYMRSYYQKNKEFLLEKQKEYYKSNKEKPKRSEEHTSEPSHTVISYAVFCLKKKKQIKEKKQKNKQQKKIT